MKRFVSSTTVVTAGRLPTVVFAMLIMLPFLLMGEEGNRGTIVVTAFTFFTTTTTPSSSSPLLLSSSRTFTTETRGQQPKTCFSIPSYSRSSYSSSSSSSSSSSRLYMSGRGIATNYTWREEAFEIEVTVPVPKETKAKDIDFKATSTSIGLILNQPSQQEEEQRILLDSTRKLRGRVVVDGTYWEISDDNPDMSIHDQGHQKTTSSTNDDNDDEFDDDDDEFLRRPVPQYRYVTVTIEKSIRTPKNDMDVIDYDWKGVYSIETDDEVTFRKYDEPEKLDVREYCATLGVDVDNINMSLVDKTMFSSGLTNQSALESLQKAGYIDPQEVTVQGDGTEWKTNDDGEAVPYFQPKEKENDERTTASSSTATTKKSTKIPFLDTDSPWHKTTVPVDKVQDWEKGNRNVVVEPSYNKNEEDDGDEDGDDLDLDAELTEASILSQSKKQKEETPDSTSTSSKTTTIDNAADPIDTLTVARLKDILRVQGLKVSGNKAELQERLRSHVQNIMSTKKQTGKKVKPTTPTSKPEE